MPSPGDPTVVRDLKTYGKFQQDLYDRTLREEAVRTFFATWQAQPGHVMWPELAMRERKLIGNKTRILSFFETPACTDTSTAFGAYMLGWRLRTEAAFLKQFSLARRREAELDPFSALWINLKAAYGLRIGGHPQQSINIALEALTAAQKMGGNYFEALVWTEIARSYLSLGELDNALHAIVLAENLMVSTIAGDDAIIVLLEIQESRADILAARRNNTQALTLYAANVTTSDSLGLASLASRNLNRAGMLAEAIGDRALGLQFTRQGLAFSLDDQDSLNIPRHLMNIARRHRLSGDLDSCLVYQKRAVHWVTVYPAPKNIARMPLMQAEYYAQIGEYDTVDSLLTAAASMSHIDGRREASAELHLELIRGWMETNRPDLIYKSIQAISDLRTGVGDDYADRHITADLNLSIGQFMTQRGEYAQATEALEMAETALAKRPSPTRSWTLARNRGILARDRGNFSGAEKEFRKCISLGVELKTPEQESTGRFLLGSVLLAEQRYAEARAAFPSTDESDFEGRFTTRVSALLLTGISHSRENNHDLAIQAFAEAREACRTWSPSDLIARIDLETGRAHANAGRFAEAKRLYDIVAGRLKQFQHGAVTKELAYFNGDLRRDLIEASVQIPEADPAQTLALARGVLPRWQTATNTKSAPVTNSQIIFFVGSQTSGRWLISDGRVKWLPLPGEQALNQMLAPVLADMAAPGRTLFQPDARHLADTILVGVEEMWTPGESLTIVPDLALFGVPWAALPWSSDDGMMLDRGPLTVLDQPAVGHQDQRSHGPAGRLFVVGVDGNASVRGAGLSSLRHAESEARAVAAAWPNERATLRLGTAADQALTTTDDLATYEAIHVASHAVVIEGHSQRSMLLLAGEESEALTGKRISELDLNAELVFLSCCEAGDGRDTHAGYTGLARSFLDAGARSVVAPLINIDDEAAKYLSGRFYAHWLAGKPVAAALRAAQLELRDNDDRWSHPFYWAFYQAMTATE